MDRWCRVKIESRMISARTIIREKKIKRKGK